MRACIWRTTTHITPNCTTKTKNALINIYDVCAAIYLSCSWPNSKIKFLIQFKQQFNEWKISILKILKLIERQTRLTIFDIWLLCCYVAEPEFREFSTFFPFFLFSFFSHNLHYSVWEGQNVNGKQKVLNLINFLDILLMKLDFNHYPHPPHSSTPNH